MEPSNTPAEPTEDVAPESEEPSPQARSWVDDLFIGAMAMAIVVAVAIGAVLVVPHLTQQASFRNYDYNSSQFGIHMDSDGAINKTYDSYTLSELTDEEIKAQDIFLFENDDYIRSSWVDLEMSTTVDVNGVSYPFDTWLVLSIDSPDVAVNAYNVLLTEDPSIDIRTADDNYSSLGQYVLSILEPKFYEALTKGDITAPTVNYLGTGSEYFDETIASAYKAHVSGNYDFQCKYLDIGYPNWDEFADQTARALGFPKLRVYNSTEEYIPVETKLPCAFIDDEEFYDSSSEEA